MMASALACAMDEDWIGLEGSGKKMLEMRAGASCHRSFGTRVAYGLAIEIEFVSSWEQDKSNLIFLNRDWIDEIIKEPNHILKRREDG